jgi:hypothetical protein
MTAPCGDGPTPEAVLADGLTYRLGRPVRIAAVRSEPLETSSHPIDRLRVTLDSGEQLRVMFKRPQPGEKLYGNEREVLIYQRLLRGKRFGAPELYASVFDEPRGRFWLFLEDLGDWTLEHGDVPDWAAACRWLAGVHAAYAGREGELRGLRCLGEHGPDYFRAIARAAREHLLLADASWAVPRFDALVEPFDSVVSYLSRQPRTLVHGDIFTGNLILQPGPLIRPIDWESAAVGLAAWDLTRLLDGWGPEKAKFTEVYLGEFERLTGWRPDKNGFSLSLEHCQIVNALWHLRWSVEECRDAALVEGGLSRMETIWRRLGRDGADA